MGDTSYRMRMYKRRIWQERTRIVLTGSAIWLGVCIIVAVIATGAR